MMDNEYKLDESELEPPRPLSAERRAEIDEINGEIADLYREIRELSEAGEPSVLR